MVYPPGQIQPQKKFPNMRFWRGGDTRLPPSASASPPPRQSPPSLLSEYVKYTTLARRRGQRVMPYEEWQRESGYGGIQGERVAEVIRPRAPTAIPEIPPPLAKVPLTERVAQNKQGILERRQGIPSIAPSGMTDVQFKAQQKGTLISPRTVGELVMRFAANKMTDEEWADWQTKGFDVTLPVLGKRRFDLKGLADFALSLGLDPATYFVAGPVKKGAEKLVRAVEDAAKEAEIGKALTSQRGAIGKVPKKVPEVPVEKLPPGLKKSITSLSTEELEKRVVKASPHQKLYRAELERRGIPTKIAPEAPVPPKAKRRVPLTEQPPPAKPPEAPITPKTARRTPLIEQQPPVEPPGPPLLTKQIMDDSDNVIKRFRKILSAPETEAAFERQKVSFTQQRGKRFRAKEQAREEFLQQGIGAEEAERKARTTLVGKFQREQTAMDFLTQEREVLFSRIQSVLAGNEAEITGTSQALRNALAGNAIPNVKGIAGMSARDRLVKVFGEEFVENMERLRSRLEITPPIIVPARETIYSLYGKEVGEKLSELSLLKTVEGQDPFGLKRLTKLYEDTMKRVQDKTPDPRSPEGKALAIKILQQDIDATRFTLRAQRLIEPVKPVEWPAKPDIVVQPRLVDMTSSEKVKAAMRAAGRNTVDAINLVRSIITTFFDNSIPGRQLIVAGARHPIMWARATGNAYKALVSENIARRIDGGIRAWSSMHPVWEEEGLTLTKWGIGVKTTLREETAMSRWTERIPGVRQSARAATTAANLMRKSIAQQAEVKMVKLGLGRENYREMARLINVSTGRGTLPKSWQGFTPLLNAILFSPRLAVSRVEPIRFLASSSFVRNEAIKTYAAFLGMGSTVLGLYSLAGGKVELDPRSADFSKLIIGDTRIDIWGGHIQYARFLAQLITGERKLETGEIKKVPMGGRFAIAENFFQSKTAPLPSLLIDILQGKDYQGRPMMAEAESLRQQAYSRLTPLWVQDLIDATVQEGKIGGLLGLAAYQGVGVITYDRTEVAKAAITIEKNLRQVPELKRLELPIGDVGASIRGIPLTDVEKEHYKLGYLINLKSKLGELLYSPDYEKAPDYEKKKLIQKVQDDARTLSVNDLIKGVLSQERPKDEEKIKLLRQDIGRVAGWMRITDDIKDATAKSRLTRIMRYLDPNLDIALNMTGYRTDGGLTEQARIALIKRRNGVDVSLEGGLDMATINQYKAALVKYFGVDDAVWATLPLGSEELSKTINKLEESSDINKKRQAMTMLKQRPDIVRARSTIAYQKNLMRVRDPVVKLVLSDQFEE